MYSYFMKSNALALEYQRDYGTANGNLNISNLVNNPQANGVCRVFGLRLPEEGAGILFADVRSFGDYRTDPLLVTQNCL